MKTLVLYPYFKRALDVVVALIGFVLLGPLMIAIAICLRCSLRGPVLFVQVRPGLHGKPFHLVKFRSMSETCDANGALLPDCERLTRLGRLLRASSLDELPQLWNVLKGDMSCVGPRPLLMEYLPLYTPRQARRHEVRPGITGWAQVNGRNLMSWDDKFEYDVWYVDHQSFALDMRIFFLTFVRVARPVGITSANHASAEKFTGSNA